MWSRNKLLHVGFSTPFWVHIVLFELHFNTLGDEAQCVWFSYHQMVGYYFFIMRVQSRCVNIGSRWLVLFEERSVCEHTIRNTDNSESYTALPQPSRVRN